MCIGIPMQIESVEGVLGRCIDDDRLVPIDLSLVPDAGPGDWVLTFLGTARQKLTPERAALVLDALDAVAAAMRGDPLDDSLMEGMAHDLGGGFSDLINREPQLPPHLEAARAAGLKEG